MRPLVLTALLSLAFAFSGCSADSSSLDEVYGTPTAPAGTETGAMTSRLVAGNHLNGSISGSAWGPTAALELDAGAVEGPRMGEANALGGGGETTPLTAPANATPTVLVQIQEAADLTGYTADYWLVPGAPGNRTEATNGTPTASVAAETQFEAALAGPGSFTVWAALSKDGVQVAAYETPFTGHVTIKWHVRGEVQPMTPPNTGGLWPTSRDDMVDKYVLNLTAGVNVVATTAFDGTQQPNQGGDVGLGLYTPEGDGIVCSDAGSGATPGAAGEATETLEGPTESAGAWSIQVGNIQGCGGTGYQYVNSGPVPYTLDLVVG